MKSRTKIIAILIALIVMVSIVSGALVSYLSNEVTADITVSSPVEQWISKGSEWESDSVTLDNVLGGEVTTIWVKTENKANVAITGEAENIVTNPLGVTCADFESVLVTTTTDGIPDGPHELIGLCSEIETWKVEFSYGPTPIIWAAEQVDETKIEVRFKTNASGTYTFTSEIVPV